MDSDKENAPASLSTSNSSLLHYRSMPEDLNSTANSTFQPANRTQSTSQILPDNLDLSEPVRSPHETRLAQILPEVGALVDRLKIVGSLNGISSELLEPVTARLHSQTKTYDLVLEQAGNAKEKAQTLLDHFAGVKKRLEDELRPLLEGFGLGLPTESWHVEATKAAVAEKLRQRSKEIQEGKQ